MRRSIFFYFTLAISATSSIAFADATMRGRVIGVDQTQHAILINHEAFGSMPQMIMPLQVDAAEPLPALGVTIDADVDQSKPTWLLHNLRRVVRDRARPWDAPLSRPAPRITPIPIGEKAPDTVFSDLSGQQFVLSENRDEILIVSFIRTRCKPLAACDTVASRLRQLQSRLPPGSRIVSITVDPKFDTVKRLRIYAKRQRAMPATWRFLTSGSASVATVASQLGVGGTARTDGLTFVDRNGIVADRIDNADWTADGVIRETQRWLPKTSASDGTTWWRLLLEISVVVAVLAAFLRKR